MASWAGTGFRLARSRDDWRSRSRSELLRFAITVVIDVVVAVALVIALWETFG